jgi:ketosteroid isomerase-like protein
VAQDNVAIVRAMFQSGITGDRESNTLFLVLDFRDGKILLRYREFYDEAGPVPHSARVTASPRCTSRRSCRR